MTKYSFVLLDKELTIFLQQLQEWGVVDITRNYKAVDDTSRSYLDKLMRFNTAIRSLKNFNDKETQNIDCKLEIDDYLTTVEQHLFQMTQLNLQKIDLQKAYTSAEVWGDFNTDDIEKIKSLNLDIHYYAVPDNKFDPTWNELYYLQILNRTKGKTYFILLSPHNAEFVFPLSETTFPQNSVEEIMSQIADNEEKISQNNAELNFLKAHISELIEQKNIYFNQLDLFFSQSTSEKKVDEKIAVLEGFAPTSMDTFLATKLETTDVCYFTSPAKKEDNPPVKLKNNFFATLFEPIGNLYMLPKYGELDLTPYFSPFYMLFFGLCLGDMGYGLLLMSIGIIGIWKMPKYRSYAKLIMLLGIGSVVMPAMTGTFFGVSLYDKIAMPQWFYDVWYNPDTINIKMFWFALIFGVFQIVVARLLSAVYAIRNKGWQYGIANIGWAVFVVWASCFFAEWQSNISLLSSTLSYILLGISAVCILFFSKISKNIFFRLAGGVKAAYDVTGLLGDILSYVRLFGLGAAGGILGLVMNQIALSLSTIPYIGWLLFVIMLLIGHCLVIFLSCLGAFVHPIRLTFVEFYKNANFEGGGRKFNPLKKQHIE